MRYYGFVAHNNFASFVCFIGVPPALTSFQAPKNLNPAHLSVKSLHKKRLL